MNKRLLVLWICVVVLPGCVWAQAHDVPGAREQLLVSGTRGDPDAKVRDAAPVDRPEPRSGKSQGRRDWWSELRAAAVKCHGGWFDFRVDVSGGVASRTLGDVAESGPFAEARLTVPLYSRRERQKRKQEKGVFLEHVAGIIGELRAAWGKVTVKREQAAVLREAMLQEGLAGINAFFAIKEEIVSLDAAIEAAELKLSGFIEACLGKGTGVAALPPTTQQRHR